MDILNLTEPLIQYIIRPSRAVYQLSQLGAKQFEVGNKIYERIDFQVPITVILNKQSIEKQRIDLIQASLYREKYLLECRPTVIYSHGNSSSRVSGMQYLNSILPHFDYITYDFRGCGLSDGKYITLGYIEKDDLWQIIKYTDKKFGKRQFILWGRSMGAVTTLLCAAKYGHLKKIVATIADSPFSDLEKVLNFMAEKRASMIPSFLVQKVIDKLQTNIKQKIKEEYGSKIQYSIRKLKPQIIVSKIQVPIFFIGSKKDEIVDIKQVELLYQLTESYKQLQILEGGHNEVRPDHLKSVIIDFAKASLKLRKRKSNSIKKDEGKKRKIFSYHSQKSEIKIINNKTSKQIVYQKRKIQHIKKMPEKLSQRLGKNNIENDKSIEKPQKDKSQKKSTRRYQREIMWKQLQHEKQNKIKKIEKAISFDVNNGFSN